MGYLERTLSAKQALLQSPQLLQKLKDLFVEHEDRPIPLRAGNGRVVYAVGELQLPEGTITDLLLKLPKSGEPEEQCYRLDASDYSLKQLYQELAAFDTYFALVTGEKTDLGQFHGEDVTLDNLGTFIEPGDIGAIPHFHLVVTFGSRIGFLTESSSNLCPPRGTARYNGLALGDRGDERSLYEGRIIDLEPIHTSICKINNRRGQDLFGLTRQGALYFLPENRLDLLEI
jgi:hypothetical protein